MEPETVEPRLVGADARVVGPARILILDDELRSANRSTRC